MIKLEVRVRNLNPSENSNRFIAHCLVDFMNAKVPFSFQNT
jgi:hypothetical protein